MIDHPGQPAVLHVCIQVDAAAIRCAEAGTGAMTDLLEDAHNRLDNELYRLKHQMVNNDEQPPQDR